LGVIGFTVQFVTEDHGLQSLAMRIKELEGQHNGEHMAEVIMEFIREYGIASEVGYIMMDNASNMNSMIDKVSDDLEREFDVFYDPLPQRLRCSGPHHKSGRDGVSYRKTASHERFLRRAVRREYSAMEKARGDRQAS
jgi:hypothetical protein